MIRVQPLLQAASEFGIEHAAVVETSSIRFHEDFRKACERNACGKYDSNWMGPPAIGPVTELKEEVLRFNRGLLIETVHRLDNSFDFKGMHAAAEVHQAMFRSFLERIRRIYPDESFLSLDAGCCSYCEKCAYQDRNPCRHPDQAMSSVEAYGMDVGQLMKTAGLPYNHGRGSVFFVGLVLFDSTS
jgi:predicted metal-binding protein